MPKLKGLSIRAYARRRGVHHSTVQGAIETGRIRPLADGSIDPDQADRDWNENTSSAHAEGRSRRQKRTELGDTVARSKAAYEAIRARRAEIELRQLQGELITKSDVEEAAFNAGRRARDLFQGLPARLGPVVAGLTDPDDCIRVLEAEVDRICREVASKS